MKNNITINQMTIKNTNKQNLINSFEARDYLTVSDLMERTGLTSVTTNSILKELIDEKWLCESHYAESSGGRKPMVYKFNKDRNLAMQISVTKGFIFLVIMNLRKEKLFEETIDVKIKNNQQLKEELDLLMNLKEVKKALKKLIAVTITIPGVIDTETSTVLYSAPLNIKDFSFDEYFASKNMASTSVYVFKRVDGFLLEELSHHSQYKKTAYILIDDGLGLSISGKDQSERIMRSGSEIGHLIVECGDDHTILGEIFRDKSILKKFHEIYPDKKVESYKELKKKLSIETYEQNSKFIDYCETRIAFVSSNIMNLFAPELLILGGGIVEFLDHDRIVKKLKKVVLAPFMNKLELKIVPISYHKLAQGTISYALYEHVFKPSF